MRAQILKQHHVAAKFHCGTRVPMRELVVPLPSVPLRQCHKQWKSTVSARTRRESQKLSTSHSIPIHATETKPPAGTRVSLKSTRPTELILPKSDPSLSKFQFLFRTGKAYASFYWQGIKNVWANYKTVQAIQSRIGSRELDSINKIIREGEKPISFSEYELILRSRHDLKKLIPFGLIFAICGEFTPFVVLALGSRVVPATCRIPKQREKDLSKLLEKDEQAIKMGAELIVQQSTKHNQTSTPELDVLNNPQILHLTGYTLSLTPFSKPLPIPGISTFYLNFILWRRLQSHFNSIISSIILIQREGGFANPHLTSTELWEWGMKYGLHKLREDARQSASRGIGEMEMLQDDKLKKSLLPTYEREARWIMAEISAQRRQIAQTEQTSSEDDWKVLARAQADAFAYEPDEKQESKILLTPDSQSRRNAVLKAVKEQSTTEQKPAQ